MEKQILSMEELEKVSGGNIFTDAWDWIYERATRDKKSEPDRITTSR